MAFYTRVEGKGFPKQDIFFYVWGETTLSGYAYAHRILTQLSGHANLPNSLKESLEKGGRLKNIPWGDMPSGLPYALSRAGLNMMWIAAPGGDEVRGTLITHTSMNVFLHARTNPTRTQCDLVHSFKGSCPDQERIATALMTLAPRLQVTQTLSAHQALDAKNRALYTASRAKTYADLERALEFLS